MLDMELGRWVVEPLLREESIGIKLFVVLYLEIASSLSELSGKKNIIIVAFWLVNACNIR